MPTATTTCRCFRAAIAAWSHGGERAYSCVQTTHVPLAVRTWASWRRGRLAWRNWTPSGPGTTAFGSRWTRSGAPKRPARRQGMIRAAHSRMLCCFPRDLRGSGTAPKGLHPVADERRRPRDVSSGCLRTWRGRTRSRRSFCRPTAFTVPDTSRAKRRPFVARRHPANARAWRCISARATLPTFHIGKKLIIYIVYRYHTRMRVYP